MVSVDQPPPVVSRKGRDYTYSALLIMADAEGYTFYLIHRTTVVTVLDKSSAFSLKKRRTKTPH